MAEPTTRSVPFKEAESPILGLALSGGGFRTSLFHIGVLLRLAELGVLKHVQVLSTVSGGSIVGAAFYLRLLVKLREAEGAPLRDEDMVNVVHTVAKTFPVGVRANVRTKALTSYFRMIQLAQADYSLSDRVAQLFDELFFNGILSEGGPRVLMRDLEEVVACDSGAPAKGCKPRLFINATSLTTGRAWRFSGTRMGEPELRGQARDIDTVMRFEAPSSYQDLDEYNRDMPLSTAVAASSALPGGLHPMSISQMYPGLRVQLTDGGVHDNQGIGTLIEAECSHFVVSDTGGQMAGERNARTSLLSVLLRAQAILYGRVRQEQLLRGSEKREGEEAPSPLALIHLHKGLDVEEIRYIRPMNPEPDDGMAPSSNQTSEIGIDQEVMRRLAALRTDLDSFTAVEEASLMTAGYLVAGVTVRDSEWAGRPEFLSSAPNVASGDPLRMQRILPYMAEPSREYLRQLDAGAHRLFKVFRLREALMIPVRVLALVVVGGIVYAWWRLWPVRLSLLWPLGILALIGISVAVPATTWGARLLDSPIATGSRWFRNALMGWIPVAWSKGYLWLLEPLYQKAGSLEALERVDPRPQS